MHPLLGLALALLGTGIVAAVVLVDSTVDGGLFVPLPGLFPADADFDGWTATGSEGFVRLFDDPEVRAAMAAITERAGKVKVTPNGVAICPEEGRQAWGPDLERLAGALRAAADRPWTEAAARLGLEPTGDGRWSGEIDGAPAELVAVGPRTGGRARLVTGDRVDEGPLTAVGLGTDGSSSAPGEHRS